MTALTTSDARARVHAMWAHVAPQWGEHADEIDERGAAMTAAMLAAASLREGDRVLELACGAGGAGLAAADRVGPHGEVVLSDVVPEMTALASGRATQRGVRNVRAMTLDLEEIDQPEQSYDVVLCREGLMFALEPTRATREIYRVLRPGGRVAVAVWAAQENNPWLGVVFDAVTAITGVAVPPPGVPGPFALGDASRLHRLFVDAGFVDVTVDQLALPLRSPSFEAWWKRTQAVAGPLAVLLARLDTDTLAAIENRLRGAVAPYATAGGLELPGVTLVASARRP